LADLFLITKPAKIADMIFIFCQGLGEEYGFKCLRLKEAGLPAGKAGSYQVEPSRYDLDMGSF
jgi:hypothetical protein